MTLSLKKWENQKVMLLLKRLMKGLSLKKGTNHWVIKPMFEPSEPKFYPM